MQDVELIKQFINKKVSYNFFCSLPELKLYYLINGVLYMNASPHWKHQKISKRIENIISKHLESNDLGELLYAPMDVFFDEENILQPDLIFIKKGREELFTDKWYINGTPDLVIEILSPSTATLDMLDKKDIYEKFGVSEYWIVDPESETVYNYFLVSNKYVLQEKVQLNDCLKSKILVGLKVDLDKVFVKN